MARVTLEDKWWIDPRRSALIEEIKSELIVDGLAVKLFRVAQDYWKNGSGGIPFQIFTLFPHWQQLVRTGLVTVRDSLGLVAASFNPVSGSFEFRSDVSFENMFAFARGSSEYLDWLRAHKENATEAGKKSAESRKKTNGSAQPKPKKSRTNAEPKPTNPEPAGTNVEPSVSSSSSVSVSSSGSSSDSANVANGENLPAGKTLGSQIFDSYAMAYRKRHKQDPLRDEKVNSICASIAKKLGQEGIAIAAFYVSHNKPYYTLNFHPIGNLLSDADALRTQYRNNKQVTTVEARATETKQQAFNAFSKFLKPEDKPNGNP